MTALARWRAGSVVLMAVGALMPLALARQARGRSERALAARDATAAAAYLTIVTPSPPRGGAGYDLPQLLIRARALEELPGLSGRFEIYHATAPLVRATAPPLPAAARIPEVRSAPASLATLARGAEIVPGDSGPTEAWRRAAGGVSKAAVAVRLAPGRWVELRARPGEAGTAGWLPIMLGLAALGPLRALFLLPYASSVVAVGLVWQWMYHPDFGLINRVLARAGLGPVNWLGDPKTALLAVMLVSVWMQLGYQLTVFLAGLRAIPQAYLDAARVDGANAWQRFWRVTFPLLRPVTLFVLVTGIIGAFQVLALVMVLTGGGPLGATDVIVYRIYRTAWELLQFGDASAMALLLFAVLFGVTWVQLKLLDRRVEHA